MDDLLTRLGVRAGPAYGTGALCDVVPSVLRSLGMLGLPAVFDYPSTRSACVLLVDGLGADLLAGHALDAPFLAELAAGSTAITTGFPSTTASSIASLATGDPPAAHGIVGYTFAADSHLLNALRWTDRAGTDLRDELVPERLAPGHTLLERATAAGIAVHVVAPLVQRGSGLSRAVLRGGDFAATHAIGDLIAETVAALGGTGPRFCYTYFGDLDLVGHLYGPGSPAWRAQLRLVDRLAQMLAEQLPGGCSLTVLADHGMVTVDPELAIEFDAEAQLREGVREVGGEARARMLYVRRGAVDDVCAAWRQRLGGHYVLCSRDELIDSGLIGPSPRSEVAARLGDLLVLPTGAGAVLCRTAEPMESNLTGHHGACSSAELLIPRLVYHSR